MDRHFFQMLDALWAEGKFICLELTGNIEEIPNFLHRRDTFTAVNVPNTLVFYNKAVIDVTRDLVCAYLLSASCYEARSEHSLSALRRTIAYIHHVAPGVPVILDARRGDTRDSNLHYAETAFDYLKADAITIHTYLGRQSVQPFLDKKDKGVFVVCRTSNSGADDFQCVMTEDNVPMWERIVERVSSDWNANGNCGFVMGAMHPEEIAKVRQINDTMPILVLEVDKPNNPGKIVRAGRNSSGTGIIVCASRRVIFASKKEDFAQVAERTTRALNGLISSF